MIAGVGLSASPAAADERAAALDTTSNLDGYYLALGPIGSLIHVESGWDGAFGGEVSITRVRERAWIGALGLGFGGLRFAELEGGRLWVDVAVASRRPFGQAIGFSLGPTILLDAIVPPRWGAQATLWTFVGAIPFVRVGSVQKRGLFFELGLKVALPAFSW